MLQRIKDVGGELVNRPDMLLAQLRTLLRDESKMKILYLHFFFFLLK